jgi:hypothetical protein
MSRSLMPLEAEASDGIQHEFADDFKMAASTLSLALKVVGSTPGGPGTFQVNKPRGLTWNTVHLAFGLYAKICKQQRSIIALCELGLCQDAACIDRFPPGLCRDSRRLAGGRFQRYFGWVVR